MGTQAASDLLPVDTAPHTAQAGLRKGGIVGCSWRMSAGGNTSGWTWEMRGERKYAACLYPAYLGRL